MTKMGLLFIFDRVTGEPLNGIEERPVPQTDVPGEETWPTQPFPSTPSVARQTMTRDEVTSVTPESRRDPSRFGRDRGDLIPRHRLTGDRRS